MKLLSFIIAMLSTFTSFSQPQQAGIKGRILDQGSRRPLVDAIVALLQSEDSLSVASVVADQNGTFFLRGLKTGNYKLYIRSLGYNPIRLPVEIASTDTLVDVGNIYIDGTGVHLKMIEIVQVRTPMSIKRDTLEFNAEMYKTRENALLEELLNKLPGVQIDQDGRIKVNGEAVKKVLVNGKPFFGNDAKLAIKNLSANMIEKIQLLDGKSDDLLVGIDNTKREKTINITIKNEKKEKLLGRFSAGYGTQKKFATGVNLNRFSEAEDFTLIGGGNNVNNQGFLEENDAGIGNTGAGIIHMWNGGINYNRNISAKLKATGSYSFSDANVENLRTSTRKNLLMDTTYYYNQGASSANRSIYHNLNTQIEYKPDTTHRLTLRFNFNHANTNGNQESVFETLDENSKLVNKGRISNLNSYTTPTISLTFNFEKTFKKAGRKLSTGFNYMQDKGNQENLNKSKNQFVHHNGEISSDTIDQHINMYRRHQLFNFSLAYTEPLFKEYFIDFEYHFTTDRTLSRKLTYDYDVFEEKYNRLNDSLSNNFENTYTYHIPGILFRTQKAKYDYTIGFYMLMSELVNKKSLVLPLKQTMLNLFPAATFRYAFRKNRRLQAYYWSNPQPPTIDQLQPVLNNNNPLYVQLGNPDLKMTLNHLLSISYNALNPQTFRGFNVYVKTVVITNKIVNANWFDSIGRQLSQPRNVNGTYTIGINLANTFWLKKLKTSINVNTGLGLGRDINYINDLRSSSRNFNITQGLGFNYTRNGIFDLGTFVSISYNGVRYDRQEDNNTNYLDYNLSFHGNIDLPLQFVVGGSVGYMLNAGRAKGYNIDLTRINAYIARKLFKQGRGLIKLQGFDLLNQNQGSTRNVAESYIEDIQSTTLKRIFMLSFSYFIKPASSEE